MSTPNQPKPHLILLHGALGSKEQFAPVAELLSSNFTIHNLNLAGHGGREIPEGPFTIDLLVEDLLQTMQQQEIRQVSFMGHSLGGYVALKLALQHPERVSRIFTLGTKFDWSPETVRQEVRQLNPAKIEEKVPHFATALKERHAPANWKHVLEKTAELMQHLGDGNALKTEDLPQIQQPVTIGVGALDKLVTRSESEQVAEALPNGKLKVFENFKHPLETVDVNALVAAVRESWS